MSEMYTNEAQIWYSGKDDKYNEYIQQCTFPFYVNPALR